MRVGIMLVFLTMWLSVGSAVAQDVDWHSNDATRATGIRNLVIDGQRYDVEFRVQTTASEIYGSYPGVFDFPADAATAEAVVDAINLALNDAGATAIGQEGFPDFDGAAFNVGYGSFILPIGDIETVEVWRGVTENDVDWIGLGANEWSYNLDEKEYAVLTESTSVPTEASTWSSIKSLYR